MLPEVFAVIEAYCSVWPQHPPARSSGSYEVSQNFWYCILFNKRLCEHCIAVKRANQMCCWMRDPVGHHLLLFYCSHANQF